MPSSREPVTVTFTFLESIAFQCAARAVIESAPPGSPGEPLTDALRKLVSADPDERETP